VDTLSNTRSKVRQRAVKAWVAGDWLPVDGHERNKPLQHLAQCVASGLEPGINQDLDAWTNDLSGLRRNSTAQQLFLTKDAIEWRASRHHSLIHLLLADLEYAPVKQRHGIGKNDPSYIVVIAPRWSKCRHAVQPNGKQVWFLCVKGACVNVLQHFLFQLGSRGALRYDFGTCCQMSSDCHGQGGQGVVFSGTNVMPVSGLPKVLQDWGQDLHLYEVHRYNPAALKIWTKNDEEQVRKEVCFLQAAAGHPNVSAMFGLFMQSMQAAGRPGSEAEMRYILVMELCTGGDVHEHASSIALNEQTIAEVLMGVSCALTHLHRLQIVHRDVKAENVVIQKDHAVLIDFGIAAYLWDCEAMRECVGSPGYAAPEVIIGRDYNESIDCFALGVLLYFMVYGSLPFKGPGSKESLEATAKCNVVYPELARNEVPPEILTLMKELLSRRWRERPTASQVFHKVEEIESPRCLEWAAYKVSMAAMVKCGYIEDPQNPDLDVYLHGPPGGKPDAPRVQPRLSTTDSVAQQGAVLYRAVLNAQRSASANLRRGMRHIPEFLRNVSARLQQQAPRRPSARALRSRIFSGSSAGSSAGSERGPSLGSGSADPQEASDSDGERSIVSIASVVKSKSEAAAAQLRPPEEEAAGSVRSEPRADSRARASSAAAQRPVVAPLAERPLPEPVPPQESPPVPPPPVPAPESQEPSFQLMSDSLSDGLLPPVRRSPSQQAPDLPRLSGALPASPRQSLPASVFASIRRPMAALGRVVRTLHPATGAESAPLARNTLQTPQPSAQHALAVVPPAEPRSGRPSPNPRQRHQRAPY